MNGLRSMEAPKGSEAMDDSRATAGEALSIGPTVFGELDADPSEVLAGELTDLYDPRLYINRELSMLAFNRRVLEEAEDTRNPILERVKFLAITNSNLEEYFMIRVAGLKQQVDAGVVDVSPDGMSPAEQLAAVRREALALMDDVQSCWSDELIPQLSASGIHVLDYADLTPKQKAFADEAFQVRIFPVLTPLAFDPGRPFPHISNLSLNLAVRVRDARGNVRFARVKVPSTLPRLVPLKRNSGSRRQDGTVPYHHYFVWLEQLIAANLNSLFPGMEILEAHPFHITRDADMDLQELEASDLLENVERLIRQRRFGDLVRLTMNSTMPKDLRSLLAGELGVAPSDIYAVGGPIALSGIASLHDVDRHDLKDPPFTPAIPRAFDDGSRQVDFFEAIRADDVLVHHPFESFSPVLGFLESAADDANVLAIKQTLYRVGRNAPVVAALMRAREHGKQVAALVELKARFDEESNISWARALEDDGVHVVYGLVGLKVHCKVALVVRSEGNRIRRYVHLATGNYNAVTANLYTDLGLFTCDDDIGADATDLFNLLTGYSAKTEFRKLIVAPINMRERFLELIRSETERHRLHGDGRIIFKLNSLVDAEIIRCLYQASRAGVEIDLIVRGICCLRPGIKGTSETIRVRSIVGRFLEHSRIFAFGNGNDSIVYLGSADLMPRNIDRRVEVLFPVESPALRAHLVDDVLAVYLRDNVNARELMSDGSYRCVNAGEASPAIDSQAELMAYRERTGPPIRPLSG